MALGRVRFLSQTSIVMLPPRCMIRTPITASGPGNFREGLDSVMPVACTALVTSSETTISASAISPGRPQRRSVAAVTRLLSHTASGSAVSVMELNKGSSGAVTGAHLPRSSRYRMVGVRIRYVLPMASDARVEQLVRARMERQALATRDTKPLELWAIVDEAALRRVVGSAEIMRAQIKHIIEMAQRPNVTFQVIPYDKGAHPGMAGSFVHMAFEDELDPELVYLDSLGGDVFLETWADIRRYRTLFDHLRTIALSPRETTMELVAWST